MRVIAAERHELVWVGPLPHRLVTEVEGLDDLSLRRQLGDQLGHRGRDGLVTRGYELTPLGRTMLVPIEAMGQWASEHGAEVTAVR